MPVAIPTIMGIPMITDTRMTTIITESGGREAGHRHYKETAGRRKRLCAGVSGMRVISGSPRVDISLRVTRQDLTDRRNQFSFGDRPLR